MSGATSWSDLKQQGNDLFKSSEFLKAAAKYTAAIKAFDGKTSRQDDLAVLHSNRCAALLKVSKVTKALGDADKCIELRPGWEKGYFRKGSSLEALSEFQAALEVYREGAKASSSSDLSVKAGAMETKLKKLAREQKAAART